MAEKDIIQNMISQLGQSQDQRLPAALGIHYADVDERTAADFLRFIKNFSPLVNYYRGGTTTAIGDWSNFFPKTDADITTLLAQNDGQMTPHLALFLTFLELYKKPQDVINQTTGRHLDFYYQRVLQLSQKPAVPDKAHVVLKLKKQASPIAISPANVFSAGKDATGVEMLYAPTGTTVINGAKVDSLRSIYSDATGNGVIRYAPIANSSDGVGGKLDATNPKWDGFGNDKLPAAEIGFAIASPVLLMKEGSRSITVTLTLSNVDDTQLNETTLDKAFDVFVTGEKGWMGPYTVSPSMDGSAMQFEFSVPDTEKGVIAYDSKIHGYSYATTAPVMQVLLKTDNTGIGYKNFQGVTLASAKVEVSVTDVKSLALESDSGTLDPKKAFLPFGPRPTKGSQFFVGYDEAFSKKLSQVELDIQWKGAPQDFSTYYSGYDAGSATINNNYFTTTVSFKDGGSWNYSASGQGLFESSDATQLHTMTFSATTESVVEFLSGFDVFALNQSGSRWAMEAADKFVLMNPVFLPFKTSAPETQTGFITLTLDTDFLHDEYRTQYVGHMMKYAKGAETTLTLLNDPYTPTIQSISLSYDAYTDDVSISSDSLNDFSNPDIQFFHISYFGRMREHGYQRQQFDFLADKSVSLLPSYDDAGELLIGFSNLNPDDSVSVLFQVAEGSANPDLTQETVTWSVLCDNYWKPLGSGEVILDTTNQLLTSGIIQFVIPADATTTNTILSDGKIWLRASVPTNVTAVSQLIDVVANAIETQFVDQGNDPNHLTAALPANSISKLKNGLSAVKTVTQPHASFGGNPTETGDAFHTRVSERLRHKDRCITPWDYERVVLQAFPKVHKVKCIPHAKPIAGDKVSWLAPGNVMIVVVPDLRNKNAMDPLQPKVDADTISKIGKWVQQRDGMQVTLAVKNPRYQKVKVDFKVKFLDGYEFNFYSKQLNQQLIEFLSPWAYQSDRDISFGGKIYKSTLLDFVEDIGYVDYVTDFKMYSYTGDTNNSADLNEVMADTPDAILVSDGSHAIAEIT